MKKTLVTVLAAAAMVATSYGQGTISFANGAAQLITLDGSPAAAASAAKVQLYWAPAGTTDFNLFQAAGAAVNVGVPLAGRFSGGTRTVGLTGDGNAGGTYAIAVAAYIGTDYASSDTRGVSAIFGMDTGDPTSVPAGTPALLNSVAEFTGVNMTTTVIPEPTSMALAGLGAASLLIFRRRK